jgi:hypothetical protein
MRRGTHIMDLVYLGVLGGFFGLGLGLVRLLERL